MSMFGGRLLPRFGLMDVNSFVVPSVYGGLDTHAVAAPLPWAEVTQWQQQHPGIYGAPFSIDHYNEVISLSHSSGFVPEFHHRGHPVLYSEGQNQTAYQEYSYPSTWQCQPDNFLQLPHGHLGIVDNLAGVVGPEERGNTYFLVPGDVFRLFCFFLCFV